jgi:hypothetical protein
MESRGEFEIKLGAHVPTMSQGLVVVMMAAVLVMCGWCTSLSSAQPVIVLPTPAQARYQDTDFIALVSTNSSACVRVHMIT